METGAATKAVGSAPGVTTGDCGAPMAAAEAGADDAHRPT
jgi:hypothetical protein